MQVTCVKTFEDRGSQGRFAMKKGESQDLPDEVADRLERTGLVRAKKGSDDADGSRKQDGHRSSPNAD